MFGRGLFPQSEVVGVAFVALAVQFAGVGHDVVEIAARKTAVVVVGVVFFDVEIDRAVRYIGVAGIENPLYERDLFDDMPRGVGFDRRRLDIQCIHRTVVALGVIVRYFHRFELLQAGFLGDFVFALVGIVLQVAYVGDVADVAYLVARRFEVAEQQVERHRRTGMPQVRVAVDRRTADVQACTTRSERFESFFAPCQRIVEYQF